MNNKTNEASFLEEGKETFKNRLKQLLKGRSLRAVSTEWQIPYSTLNNYFDKKTLPSLYVAQKIARIEGVSLEWLASGTPNEKPTDDSQRDDTDYGYDELKTAWSLILDSLDVKEAKTLINLMHRKGIEGILTMIHEKQDIEELIDKLKIRSNLKQAIKVALDGNESTDKEILRYITTLISQEKN